MANNKPGKNHEMMQSSVLCAAEKLFLRHGYTNTTLKSIAKDAGINIGSLTNLFATKEDILSELVKYVLEGQFQAAAGFLGGIECDGVLFYAAETTMQLYMAESSESVRELYAAAYSMPKSSAVIQQTITGKLENLLKDFRPGLETKDFYKLEIASGGVMRGFMTIPCDMWFTMDQKVESFLESTFLIFRIPDEKIKEAVEFVKQFDFIAIAENTIKSMFAVLEARANEKHGEDGKGGTE